MATKVVREDLSGKTFLVTGATDGIGLHTATQLALAGGEVIVHGRYAALLCWQKTFVIRGCLK